MATATATRRIWIGSWAAYNAGTLYGEWVDIDGLDSEDIGAEIARILEGCPEHGEEWGVFDYDGLPGAHFGEQPDLDELAAYCELADELGGGWESYADHIGIEYAIEGGRTTFEDAYAGRYDSLADWAQELHEDCYDLSGIPDALRYRIDWEGVARDAELSGDVFTVEADNGDILVFWNH